MAVTAPACEGHFLYRFFHVGDDEVQALRGVSLQIDPGEFVAIVGPSGSGKSTLLSCLAGLDEPDGGHVRVAGHVLTRRPEARRAALRARYIGVLLQSENLISHFDVDENIALAQRLGGDVDAKARADLLARVGLTDRARALPAQLSGGEAVRAGLAVALINQPAVVIADEPTSEVDRPTEQRLLELLLKEAESGRGVVVSTHSDAVASVATRTISLVDGKVVPS